MAVLEMRKINICALKKDRKKILEFLQRKGCLEIHETENKDSVFQKVNTATQISIFQRNAALAENALNILEKFYPEKTSMFSSLEGKKEIEISEFKKSTENQQEIMSVAKDIIQLNKAVDEKIAEKARRYDEIEALKPWAELDVPMNYKGTKKTGFLLGTILGTYTENQLINRLESLEELPKSTYAQILSSDKFQTYIAVVFLKQDEEKTEKALRGVGFNRPPIMTSHLPKESVKKREKVITILDNEIQEIKNKIKEYSL